MFYLHLVYENSKNSESEIKKRKYENSKNSESELANSSSIEGVEELQNIFTVDF